MYIDVKEFFPSLRIVITKKEYPELFNFLYVLKNKSFDFFDCDFKNNICIENKLYGCCSTCLKNYGFYKYDTFLLEDPEYIISKFRFSRSKYNYGFLIYGLNQNGCILDRYIRSNPCNIHKCFKPEDKIEQKKMFKYDELISDINNYFLDENNLTKNEIDILIDLISENKNNLNFLNIKL